jgi:hypothetical protein
MTQQGKELTQEVFEDKKYDEEWRVVMNTGGNYTLGKIQARILQQAIATGNRGVVMFNSFAISIPYIAEFYMVKRFLKGSKQLSANTNELPFKPMSRKKFEELMKRVYRKVGRKYESK